MNPRLSFILPCQNEEQALPACLDEIREAIRMYDLQAEVIVVDNASSDRSAAIVKERQAAFPQLILAAEERPGYGLAYLKGFSLARGDYLFLADADHSYNFQEVDRFLARLDAGADLVIGNRFAHKLAKQTMPWSHKYLGNPFLSFLVKKLFKIKVNDIHCGARALKRSVLDQLSLRTGGMEFASEMIIKAGRARLRLDEVPISYRPRLGKSKLNSWRDGWRHLRFILIYSPLFLFLWPGLFLFGSGALLTAWFYFFTPVFFGLQLYVHPLFFSVILMILGYQLIFFGAFAKIYAVNHLGDRDDVLEKMFRHLTIEKAGSFGLLLALSGTLIYLAILIRWIASGFGSLDEIKNSIIALALSVLGVQTFFSAFMLSILGIKEK